MTSIKACLAVYTIVLQFFLRFLVRFFPSDGRKRVHVDEL